MKQSRKGFTLVEMLVVISIISLLSSVVLGSVNDARVKFQSTRTSSGVEEYRKAFALAYDKYGGYPQGTQVGPSSYCLGSSPSCSSGGDPVVNGIVLESLPTISSSDYFRFAFGADPLPMSGPSYEYFTCTTTNGSTDNKNACNTASIRWWSSPSKCVPGAGILITPGVYWCTLVLD